MSLAFPLPWWAAAVAASAVVLLAWLAYRRPLVPLSRGARATLMALRALSLAGLIVLLCRPVVERPPANASGVVLPVLVDTSRSMQIADAEGETRLARARQAVEALSGPLSARFSVEVFAAADQANSASIDALEATGRRSDLSQALRSVRERYRGRSIAGIVLVSDGGDTGNAEAEQEALDVPVFAIGVGSPAGLPDREILSMTADDLRIDQASVDLHVSAVSRGFGRQPFAARLTANGRLVESRTLTPEADAAPVETTFTVYPDAQTATVYVAEVSGGGAERVLENNQERVMVSPPGRRRRVLAISGAPGYEHTFLMRALGRDSALEVDAVIRQGQAEGGQDTFLVQAPSERSPALTRGFPATRTALFAYDAVILANVDADRLTRPDLELLAAFVSERGGGLVVLGGRALATRALAGTPLDAALPVELSDRTGGPPSDVIDRGTAPHSVIVTGDGRRHPIMQIGSRTDDVASRWATLPPLASTAPLGGSRPGATVLALTMAPSGAVYPLIATQRFGRGRTLVFGGEASWRWRMQRSADDRIYEFFWRQAVRWLAAPSPDRMTMTLPDRVEPGDTIALAVDVRDEEFRPMDGAAIEATISGPDGATSLAFRPDSGAAGRYAAAHRPETEGIYRFRAEARRGSQRLAAIDRWIAVGGERREFADPRLNEQVLTRLAERSGGRYARAGDLSELLSELERVSPVTSAPEWQDAWHRPWVLMGIVGLLSAEWLLRRRWGLR